MRLQNEKHKSAGFTRPTYLSIINDPWPATPPNSWNSPVITIGQRRFVSYQWICNGRNALPGETADDGIWDRYVVVETTYSGNTLPPFMN